MSGQTPYEAEFDRAARRLGELAKTDPQVAAVVPDDRVTRAIQDPSLSYQQVLTAVLFGYADRQALGVRAYEIRDGTRHHFPTFTTISYGQLAKQAEAISCAWRYDPRFGVRPGEFVSCVVFTGAEFIAVDMGCVYSQAVSVPIQANLASDAVVEILKDTAPSAMVVSIDYLDLATDYVLGQGSFRSMVVINANTGVDAEREAIERARSRLEEAGGGIALATFAELVEIGRAYEWTPLPPRPEGRDALSMLMYTSGSTGTPKGAQIHEGICLMFWTEIKRCLPIIIVADAPVNHWMGRVEVIMALASGGTCYFTLKTDLSTFVEDVQTVRPTFMQILPRFAELVYQTHLSDVQSLVSRGVDPDEADAQMRKKLHTYLGDRVAWGVFGSSPTAPEVKQFFRTCFDIGVGEGYGSTECSGGATTFGDRVNRSLVIDYKLRDVPELGYYTTDKPYPRGELVVKTRHQIKGYFKRPEATASVFDENGYVITGDIMEERGPDHIVWLDRRSNVIKLSQAEFVAITPLENAYLGDNNPLVTQIYVYGSSYRAFMLAVVVPDIAYAGKLLGHEPSDEELRVLVLEHLQARARAVGLKSFEVPRDVVIEREPFCLENGLLSSVRKILRPNLKRRYGDRLEAIYEKMDRQRREELVQLHSTNSSLGTRDRVAGAFKANLGLATVDPSAPQSYRDLGGDSLGAVGLNKLLKDLFQVSPPVSIILSPGGSVEVLANFIDQALAGPNDRPTFSSVHGKNTTSIRASDLTLPSFFDTKTLEAAAQATPPRTDQARTVLLTGATGFLGRFLCLQWMESLAARQGKVIAIVRARDAVTAHARIDGAIGTVDKELTRHYQTLAKNHLEVIVGDLALPMLGQGEEEFGRLAREVDQIVHCGALVNHRLAYQDLFEPNVVGTAELIRLALTGRLKRFDYVSTVGVPYTNPRLLEATEDADVRVDSPEMSLADKYAMGYTASKWAGEVLLRDAHELFGLPVNVFRPNMILAHSTYRGQINVPDMFTRLLLSVVATGLAPRSFYELQKDGSCAKTHYDGTPVDVLAGALREIGDQPYAGFHSYNTINMHHDDGISYDSYVDWIESAGYPVQRIENHADWYQRFDSKLRNLPEQERQRSSLNIVEHFQEPHPVDTPTVSTKRFEEAIGSQRVPHITEGFIHKYLGDMVALGLIMPKPALSNGV
ncbi:thioester reductase domain-containing protein [Phialemonium atrogriseum]|uniref:Thioester reductase domain-containing protein n=1 Tax=Phialemonium atrogriseum TaxID=1093897 RepID=A0AAJ0BQU1_9PEZI|nr:thioester reductase domain-containing protein [Phialemonium atrogriseum]KAK1762789.1 thioester reductase domain-containing protein [Phialemonium atrogriseum]